MFLFTIIVVVIALIGILMTLVILLQSGKGGGLAGIAAGGATQQLLGARTAPDVLEKATWTLATIFILLCIATNFVMDAGEGLGESVIQSQGQEQVPVQPPVQLPGDAGAAGDGAAADPAPIPDGGS